MNYLLFFIIWYLIGLGGTCLVFTIKGGGFKKELDSILMLAVFGLVIWIIILMESDQYAQGIRKKLKK
jgi:hypothetical protein